jgi:hypothetical protein
MGGISPLEWISKLTLRKKVNFVTAWISLLKRTYTKAITLEVRFDHPNIYPNKEIYI